MRWCFLEGQGLHSFGNPFKIEPVNDCTKIAQNKTKIRRNFRRQKKIWQKLDNIGKDEANQSPVMMECGFNFTGQTSKSHHGKLKRHINMHNAQGDDFYYAFMLVRSNPKRLCLHPSFNVEKRFCLWSCGLWGRVHCRPLNPAVAGGSHLWSTLCIWSEDFLGIKREPRECRIFPHSISPCV